MDSSGWPKEYESSLGVPKCELLETTNAGALGYPSIEESETLTSMDHTRRSLATLIKSYFFPR
uniref:Putative ovule protein n=1 Tax=Solanum chacoense TaxID=4108 RepID=A0A0V0HYN6_SOLCH